MSKREREQELWEQRQDAMRELRDEIKRLEINLVLMAKLAADPPQFNSPITLVGAKAVRDRILKGER